MTIDNIRNEVLEASKGIYGRLLINKDNLSKTDTMAVTTFILDVISEAYGKLDIDSIIRCKKTILNATVVSDAKELDSLINVIIEEIAKKCSNMNFNRKHLPLPWIPVIETDVDDLRYKELIEEIYMTMETVTWKHDHKYIYDIATKHPDEFTVEKMVNDVVSSLINYGFSIDELEAYSDYILKRAPIRNNLDALPHAIGVNNDVDDVIRAMLITERYVNIKSLTKYHLSNRVIRKDDIVTYNGVTGYNVVSINNGSIIVKNMYDGTETTILDTSYISYIASKHDDKVTTEKSENKKEQTDHVEYGDNGKISKILKSIEDDIPQVLTDDNLIDTIIKIAHTHICSNVYKDIKLSHSDKMKVLEDYNRDFNYHMSIFATTGPVPTRVVKLALLAAAAKNISDMLKMGPSRMRQNTGMNQTYTPHVERNYNHSGLQQNQNMFNGFMNQPRTQMFTEDFLKYQNDFDRNFGNIKRTDGRI